MIDANRAAAAPPSTSSTSAASGPNGSGGGACGGRGAVLRATGMTIGLVLLSRVLGVVRDMVLTARFGQNETTTVFGRAFAVPDLIALVIAGGALSSVFIPVFAEYWNEKREDEAWRMFGTIMTVVGGIVAVLVIGMEAGVAPLTRLLNPRFGDAAVVDTANLTQILLPAQWCFLIGGLMMGTLYARKRFLVPALAPIFYNLGQIIGGLFFGGGPGDPTERIASMAWGALIGAFAGNIVLPFWELWRVGVRWTPGWDLSHPGVRRVGQLMIPVLLGQSLSQLNMWITGFFLPEDARYSALRNAYNLTQAPIGVFAQAFGIVLLPTISTLAAQKDWPAFREAVSLGVRRVLFLTIPASLLMAALAFPLVRVLYKQGKFGEADVGMAAAALLCYSLSTFAWSALAILARGFYARQDTWTPVLITTPMVAAFAVIGFVYTSVYRHGYLGLALGTSLVGVVTMLLFLFLLQKKVGGLNVRGIAASVGRITLAADAGAAIAYGLARVLEPALGLNKLGSLVTLLVAGGVGLVVYAGLCVLLRVPELRGVRDMFRRPRGAATESTVEGTTE